MTGEGETQPTDPELLDRHAKGDHEAFGLLFARHRDRLWAVALRTLGDPEEAADALQEAMISAFRRAGSFRGDSAVTTWLHRIVVNACLDRVRRRAARPTVPAGDERSLDGLVRAAAAVIDPAADRTAALDVEAALRLLPFEQRAALVLVDMMGYPVQIAADLLGVSVGTIKSRCARGRARLAPYLSHLTGAELSSRGDPVPEPGSTLHPTGNHVRPGGVSPAQGDGSGPAGQKLGGSPTRPYSEPSGGTTGRPLEGGGDGL